MQANPVIALIQMSMSPDPAENLARAGAKAEEAARRGAGLICLPELFRSRYFCQTEDQANFALAEPIQGGTARLMGEIAKRHGAMILAPLFERRAPGVYHNSLAAIDGEGNVAGIYRKMHIPNDPGFCEKYYFAPGDTGFRVFESPAGPVAPLICWDQWYPEAARLAALGGAGLLVYPTAIGWLPSEKGADGAAQLDAWRTVQRGHAIANGVFVAAINRTGFEEHHATEGIEFWGNSFICDPFGRVLAQASPDKEETLLAEIDLTLIEKTRQTWPFLRDRRIDAYGGISERFGGGI